ncbi:MAG: nucleotide-binding protein [Flavobacteriales bacterium]|nr:nucleotide-binding protein [Flavobacteriales bacterium]
MLSRAGINNIVLHEQLDKGRTVIDKLIQEGSDAGYAIALLTPDDSQLDGGKRARQNVVLELGYFMGRLGKERVRMLLKGGIEMPTDLSGVLYERYDEHGAWKIKLLKEIMAVGIYVDITAAVEKICLAPAGV